MPSQFAPLAAVAGIGAAVMVLGAVGVSVPRSDLEAGVAAELSAVLGISPDVSCDGDLPGQVHATTSCTAVDPGSGDRFSFAATVTEVDRGDVRYRIAVAGRD